MVETTLEHRKRPDKPEPEPAKSSWQDISTAAIGLLAIIGFGWFIIYLVRQAANPSMSELIWTRMTYLLTGVEAIAFAAAGYFFGKEVHRKQAESAEKRADIASEQADDAKTKAVKAETKGNTLRQAINSAAQGKGDDDGIEAFGIAGSGMDMSFLSNLANELFPE
jgi:hypothetical protein